MLQRDLKDIRDCGLISVVYDKTQDRYVLGKDPDLDEPIPVRRKQHLLRLFRHCTAIQPYQKRGLRRDGLDAQIVVGEEIDDLLDVALKVFPKRLEPGRPLSISGDGGHQAGDGSLVEF